jgi:hypothetical protein
MVNAQQLNGVWFPGFYCPKYLETYTYVDILMHKYGLSREEAEARKRYEAERIAAAAGVSPLWTMSTEGISHRELKATNPMDKGANPY